MICVSLHRRKCCAYLHTSSALSCTFARRFLKLSSFGVCSTVHTCPAVAVGLFSGGVPLLSAPRGSV